jgi:hypothetical protein
MTIRDAVGRFMTRQAMAAEPEAAEVIEADELFAVVQVEGADFDLPETPAGLHQRLAALRGERQQLLATGDVDAVVDLDAEIARCMVGLESAQAQADRFYDEAPVRERTRLLDLWQRVHGPRIEAARARRDAAALEIWQAIDDCAAVETEAAAIATALGWSSEITPIESPVTRWMLQNWIAAHMQRQSQRAA